MTESRSITEQQALLGQAQGMIESGRFADAIDHLVVFTARFPGDAVGWGLLGAAYCRAGATADALVALRRSTRLRDDLAFVWAELGAACSAASDPEEAAIARWRAHELQPQDPESIAAFERAIGALGSAAQKAVAEGDETRANELFDLLLLLAPTDRRALHDKGVLLYRAKHYAPAIDLLKMADAQQRTAIGLCNLGSALADSGRVAAALATYNTCLELYPNHAPAAYNAACTLVQLQRHEAAEAMYRKAIALQPGYAEAYNNLGSFYSDYGRHAEALELYRKALQSRPDYLQAYDNLIYALYYLPDTTGEDLAECAREWVQVDPTPMQAPAVITDTRRDRKLRIAYLSPDFRDHAVSYFIEPLLEHHDRDRFDVHCYSLVEREDAVTERMKNYGARWCSMVGRTDSDIAERIRADQIDILVDCAGHTKGNRLPLYGRRPAPIQVANHLGLAGTLGVPAITHFFSDPYIAPPGRDGHFTEQVVRLPRVFLPFRPRPEWPGIDPREGADPVFSCFSEPLRISDPLILAWRRILAEMPRARLLLKHPRYANAAIRDHLRARLGLGERVEFEDIAGGWGKNWHVYRKAWVMLDTFPVTGATSSIIPLWMGTPVVSIAGHHPGQRFGVSMLTNAGYPEWVTDSFDAYVAKAVALASAPDALDQYRAEARQRLGASALFDQTGVVGELEQAYRELWADQLASRAL